MFTDGGPSLRITHPIRREQARAFVPIHQLLNPPRNIVNQLVLFAEKYRKSPCSFVLGGSPDCYTVTAVVPSVVEGPKIHTRKEGAFASGIELYTKLSASNADKYFVRSKGDQEEYRPSSFSRHLQNAG